MLLSLPIDEISMICMAGSFINISTMLLFCFQLFNLPFDFGLMYHCTMISLKTFFNEFIAQATQII